MTLEKVATLIGARIFGNTSDRQVDWLLTDSRSLAFPETTLFFALRTRSGDGHRYVADLYRRGVRSFVVGQVPADAERLFPDAVFLLTVSPLKALQRLSERHREELQLPIIGITGSNGKTVVKEWLYQLLAPHRRVTRSPRSYNSQIGVPLSVWLLTPQTEVGIFEAGISQVGEMQALRAIVQPTIGIMTNIGEAHQENFETKEEKCLEKMALFQDAEVLIYCADDAGACEAAARAVKKRSDIQLVPYGETAEGDYRVTFGQVEAGCQYFYLAGFGEQAFRLEVPGRHLVLNAAAAIAMSVELLKVHEPSLTNDALAQRLASGLAAFRGGKRRSELVGRKDKLVILDDYAHHPTAIKTTLEGYRAFYPSYKLVVDFMSHTYTRTAALLEEFASSFEAADQVILHKIYGSARENASASGVDGTTLYQATCKYHPNVRYYQEILDAAQDLEQELVQGDPQFPQGIVFVTMGAGDNWKLGRELWRRLANEK